MMRSLLVLPALALLGAAPAADIAPAGPPVAPTRVISPVPSVCDSIGSVAQGEDRSPQLRRLGELPPALTYMAVYRRDSRGCIDPMLASEALGTARR